MSTTWSIDETYDEVDNKLYLFAQMSIEENFEAIVGEPVNVGQLHNFGLSEQILKDESKYKSGDVIYIFRTTQNGGERTTNYYNHIDSVGGYYKPNGVDFVTMVLLHPPTTVGANTTTRKVKRTTQAVTDVKILPKT